MKNTGDYFKMKLTPRPYQQEAINSIYNYFLEKKGNPVIALPTGTGKSIVISGFAEFVFKNWPGQKMLVLTHVKELIEQNYQKAVDMLPDLNIGVNSAGIGRRNYLHPLIFCGIGSVAKNAHKFGHVDLIFIDECHMVTHELKSQYRTFINDLIVINPNLKVIGTTATPWKLGRGHICEDDEGLFTDICYDGISLERFNEFITEGFLTPVIPRPQQLLLDVNGVGTSGGEFISAQLQNAVDKDYITEKACREMLEAGDNRNSWLVFCTGIDHAKNCADMLNIMGVPTGVIHSKLAKGERETILRDYKEGRLKCVTNANVLTTGFDHPGLDMIVILRPTMSVVLWVQMLGRGTRPKYAPGFDLNTQEGRLQAIEMSDKRDCLVLDFAGNTAKIGCINDPVIPRKGRKGKGEAPCKQCEMCNTYVPAGVRFCPVIDFDKPPTGANGTYVACGYEFVFETKLKQEASTDQLIKTDLPIVEEFEVDHITYARHQRKHMEPKIEITYYCGLRRFVQYLCVEHTGYALRLAQQIWRARTSIPFPDSVDNALKLMDKLKVPTDIRVHVNKKFPEILKYCYDGSSFGSKVASGKVVLAKQAKDKYNRW